MNKNVGKKDKTIRIVLGVVFLVLGYLFSPWFYLLAAISLVTAFTGKCLLYRLLGKSTCEVEPKEEGVPQGEVYKCQGTCGAESPEPGTCSAEGCTHHGQPLVKQ